MNFRVGATRAADPRTWTSLIGFDVRRLCGARAVCHRFGAQQIVQGVVLLL